MSEACESISKQIKAHKTRWIDYNNRLMSIALENYSFHRSFRFCLTNRFRERAELKGYLNKSENASYHINILTC